MKNTLKLLNYSVFFIILLLSSSCDKARLPNVIITDLDTSIYPGNFIDYEFPNFEQNENTLQNVLIEDFTGHRCSGCPHATSVAKGLETAYPNRVFSVAIHAGYEGVSTLQETNETYPYDFTTPEGIEMAIAYSNGDFGFLSNPTGAINRKIGGSGNLFTNSSLWPDLTEENLATELTVNLQAKSNYYPSTNGVFIHVESEFLTDIEGNFNIAVFAVRNKIIAPQLQGLETIPDYEHHNVHIGNAFGETWGRNLTSDQTPAGTKIITDFSYSLADDLNNEDIHFLVFVFNRDTYEVQQVIKHEF